MGGVDSAGVQSLVEQKVADRARAKRDKFFLANDILGFDFQECHAELFACFIQYDGSKSWAAQSDVKDRMVLWSRGHYKTTAVVVEIIQAVLNNPNVRILLMQGSIPVTKTLLKQVFAHFSGEAAGSRLMELFPEFCGIKKELHGTALQFTTCARTQLQLAQATVTVASPRSVKTGQHYDMGFFDDLVNDQNYRNQKLVEHVQEDFDLAQPLIDPSGYRFVTGTRYAFGDLYERILRRNATSGKWVISVTDCWTDSSSALRDDQKIPRFPCFTKKNGEQGGFSLDLLLQMQTDNPAIFACQYLNRPVHASRQAYTTELLRGAVINSDDTPPLSQPIFMVDLASSEDATADDSVIAVGKVDSMGIGYMCDQRGGQWSPIELALNVIDMALRHRPVKILLEGTGSCKYFIGFLQLIARQKNVFLPVDSIRVDNKADAKNMRVVSLAGVIKRGRFKFLAGLSKFDQLIEQAIEFPKGRHGHDDYIDTAALLYQELSKELLSLPIRRAPGHPILAIMADRDNALISTLTEGERQEAEQADLTGWE